MTIKQVKDYLKRYQKHVKVMEICGTHTSSILKSGIRDLLSENIRLVSGPGCPVCVTPGFYIDALAEMSLSPSSCVLSFGDLFKVTGNKMSFAKAKASGGAFHIMYSPLEALTLAKVNPDTEFIVAAVGFETTAPVYAVLLEHLAAENIANVKLAVAVKTMPEAISYICESESVDGFLCPGHVSSIIGKQAYEPLCEKYKKPFVIAGFNSEQILLALFRILRQLDDNMPRVENLYASAVTYNGNEIAQELLARYFEPADGLWRGIGMIGGSALRLRKAYMRFDTQTYEGVNPEDDLACKCGDVMLGRIYPDECGLFGTLCIPENPVGACMVSGEGACGIWYAGGKK